MEEKERYMSPVLYGNVLNYHQEMKYIAHWLWWDGDRCYTLAIGKEQDSAGLEKSPLRHPDQAFWAGKVIARPNENAIIVTDCKLLPCVKDNGCAYRVPRLIGERFGNGIPIGVFCHNDYVKKAGKFGYFTQSGASQDAVDEAMTNMFEWDWDSDSDGETY